MFRITSVNLSSDTRSASSDFGRKYIGEYSPAQAVELLERFRQIDLVENYESEPEIVFETRAIKAVVRTDQRRLYLYNSKHIDEPALVLPAELIPAELDRMATETRRIAPTALPTPAQPVVPDAAIEVDAANSPASPVSPELLTPRYRALLTGALVGLIGYITFPLISAEPSPRETEFEPSSASLQNESSKTGLAGVYMTGSEPGDHGISLAEDGALKLFQLNADHSPSVLHDTYQIGRAGGKIALASGQPGGLITVQSPDTLSFCGEIYRRVR